MNEADNGCNERAISEAERPQHKADDLLSRSSIASNHSRGLASFRFSNQPDPFDLLPEADLQYWAALPYWTVEEGIALVVRKDPERLTSTWSPLLVESIRFEQFARFREIARRAVEIGEISDRIEPGEFCQWADRRLSNVEHLRSQLSLAGEITDWKIACEIALKRFSETSADNISLRAELDKLRAVERSQSDELQSNQQDNINGRPQSVRKINNLECLLYILARQFLKYDHAQARSVVPGQISDLASLAGLGIGDRTIRTYLQEGARMVQSENCEMPSEPERSGR